jgi:uncharacterized membrane protein YdfJ with MMPL/SSD domain
VTVVTGTRLTPDLGCPIGVGLRLGVAILIDVLIIRMVVAPAVGTLLGDRAWWLPAWLDRALANISLEGPREARRR